MSDPFEPGFLARLTEPPRKVAVLRTSRIGDFILATPALRALRGALPAVHFTFIGLPFLRPLVERSPHLDRFVEFPGFPGMAEQFFNARSALHFFGEMQDEGFDLAIQLNGSGVYSNPFVLMLGARWTAGWVRPGEGAGLLEAALSMPEAGHEVDRVLTLPLFLGAAEQGKAVEFPLWREDRYAARQLVANRTAMGATLIGVHPGAREGTKRWPPERFAAAAAELQRRYGGQIVVVGGPDERSLAAQVMTVLAHQGCAALDLTGRTTLPVLGAVIEQMAVLLTNDSGPAHIAYALGTPSVTIFGGTDPARWGPPLDPRFIALTNPVACWPCRHWVCPEDAPAFDRGCLVGIRVEAVVDAAERVLAAQSLARQAAHGRSRS
jgi:ADP-heptose:LPS heptosyltransferase